MQGSKMSEDIWIFRYYWHWILLCTVIKVQPVWLLVSGLKWNNKERYAHASARQQSVRRYLNISLLTQKSSLDYIVLIVRKSVSRELYSFKTITLGCCAHASQYDENCTRSKKSLKVCVRAQGCNTRRVCWMSTSFPMKRHKNDGFIWRRRPSWLLLYFVL